MCWGLAIPTKTILLLRDFVLSINFRISEKVFMSDFFCKLGGFFIEKILYMNVMLGLKCMYEMARES